MNVITIGVAGYILLFFNFFVLIILIKKKFKCQSVSSFYILSTSDVLNSVLTAIVLLINHADMMTNTNYFHKNKRILNINTQNKYSDTFLQFYETYNLSGINYFNLTACNTKNLLMHNAMFLMPFTNAFISLITFSIQCNLSATFISDKYNNYLQSEINMEQNPIRNSDNINNSEYHNIEVVNKGDTSPNNEELIRSKDAYKNTTTLKIEEKIPQFFHNIEFKNISAKNKSIVGMSVLSQWLIPIVSTGILYFADYQNIGMMLQNENAECMYESPFSFHNCFTTNEDMIHTEDSHSRITIPIYNDYVSDTNSMKLFNLNVTENEIISKVYNIMNLALNNTYNLKNKNFSGLSDLIYTKNYIDPNNSINNINNTDSEISYNKWIIKNDNITYNWSNIFFKHENNLQIKNEKEEQIKKLLLPRNVSSIQLNLFEKNKMNKNISQDNGLINDENMTTLLVKDKNRTEQALLPISKEKILLDIISRIKTSTFKDNKKKEGTKIKKSGLQYYNIENNISTTETVTITTELYQDIDKLFETTTTCTMDKCIISTKFLRLYFLMLMFIIYFLPIILSSVLQVRSKFICQNVLSKLKEKNSIRYIISRNTCFNMEYNNKRSDHTCNQIKIYDNILQESIQVNRLLKTIKVSLIIGIMLWTPIFLQIIFKVFLCINVSTWITDCTFLCATFNDIIRNIFNLNIVTIQEIPKSSSKKENSVHPSK
ncbi:hypothetical protein V1477_002473 [Vespula maculifrons]|uniref:G-protein coupled receptors family 1 profile domain-containing protein n=1 Tax=Vespula maculifrons TaxID=7453 RepID=A0ABD2CWK6_VESMC